MNADERLAELGLSLPTIPALPGQVQPMLESVVVHGDLAYLSGIGPIGITGIVGADCSVDEGFAAARGTALLMLRRIHDAFGSLDVVDHWVKVLGFIRSAPGFAQQPAVLNGFSSRARPLRPVGDRNERAPREHSRGSRGHRGA